MFPFRLRRLSPHARLRGSTVSRLFGVYRSGQGFLPTHQTSSALRDGPPRPTRSCEILTREPAITELGWLFTPRPGSEERVARHQPYGLPRAFRRASTCPGLDRPVSDSRHVARARRYHAVPDRTRPGGRHGNGSRTEYRPVGCPAADYRFPCVTAVLPA